MNEWEIDELDRDLDALAQGGQVTAVAAGAPDLLGLLALVTATDWPDRAAGGRVAEAVAAKAGAGTGGGRPAGEPAVRPSGPARRRLTGRRRHVTRRAVVLVSAAAMLLGGAITVAAMRGGTVVPKGQAAPQVYHSRFAAALLAGQSRSAGHGRRLAGGWQLVSYLSSPGWHAHYIGTPPGNLACPTTTVCYLTAARPVPESGFNIPGPEYNLLEVSRDGGATWATLSLPSDISITTPLQCPVSATTCYAAGYDARLVVLLRTADGGRTWSARRIPGSVTFADALACTADDRCVGLFLGRGWAPGFYQKADNARVLVTHDGGQTWSAGPPTPHGQLPDYLACGGPTCVLLDQLITQDNNQSVNGNGSQTVAPGSWAAWYSHDGGATWQRGQHPETLWTMASHDLPAAGAISCSDRLHCWAAMSNQIGDPAIATAFAVTSDGGATWTTQFLPVRRASQFSPQAMSCPTVLQCYAAGGDSVGPVILTTRDGGAIWTPVHLPKTSTGNPRDGGAGAIGLIACAAASHCVAAPTSSQSAHSVPVYSLGSG